MKPKLNVQVIKVYLIYIFTLIKQLTWLIGIQWTVKELNKGKKWVSEIFVNWNIDVQMIILLNWSPFLKPSHNNFLMISEHRSIMKSLSLNVQ